MICSTGSPLLPESFEYVYRDLKKDLCLASIAGGTDILGCFALGNPTQAVFPGEIQVRSLGMHVQVFDEEGKPLVGEPGEWVCTQPFPSMPIGFWNDPEGELYNQAYFDVYDNVWRHGDWVELTERGGCIMHGRSDTTLNPGGVRIGSSEITRQVESFDEVKESLAVGQQWEGDERVLLYIILQENFELTEELVDRICKRIRSECSPRHVPAEMYGVKDLPRTRSGKVSEMAVKKIVNGQKVANKEALANPEVLEFFLPEKAIK
jgi:acetoacetyl-CoA synthetase